MAEHSDVLVSPGVSKHVNKGKKRQIHVEEWRDVKNKVLRNAGKTYVSRKGYTVAAKSPPVLIRACSCKMKGCAIIFDNDQCSPDCRRQYYEDFYKLDYNGQSMYLKTRLKLQEVKRRKQDEAVSRRHCTVEYFLGHRNKTLQVCRKTLCNLLQVTPRRLQLLIDKMKLGLSSTQLYDKRGRHDNRPHVVTDDVRQAIKTHIESYPAQESHYARQQTARLYLDCRLNVKKMYKNFKTKNPELLDKIHTYRNIFNSDYNLKFGAPRSDTCSYCDKMYIQLIAANTEDENFLIPTQSELHHRKAEISYKNLDDDIQAAKQNENMVVLCVDLQQVLFCPTLTHSDIFYQRQYATYNFAVHNMGKNEASMCIWHESVAKRGSAEISACLLKYITQNYQRLAPGDTRTLVVWSDRCVGQNNNWKMISLYHYLLNLGYFTDINQKFLVSGHSFLPCDRDFALIERAKKRSSKIYHPKQWVELIANVKEDNPFVVLYMTKEDFLDITQIERTISKPKELKITTVQWINFSIQNPSEIRIRESHNLFRPWYSYFITKKVRGVRNQYVPPVVPPITTLPHIYDNPLPIKAEKKENLLSMCQYIPAAYREFYENLLSD